MKTQKRKVGRPKLKKEVEPKKKKKKVVKIEHMSNLINAVFGISVRLESMNRKIQKINEDFSNYLVYLKNEEKPQTPPMEEPKSEETPH